MIASVRGRVAAVTPTAAVVEVGGVGMLVQCTPVTLAQLRTGEEASLSTSLVVRETELTLYGFADADEREVFEALQTAAGVGPRLAQAVLAVHAPDEVRRAVAMEDLAALTLVPGIGRKGAQRIVLDLKDRLGPPSGGAAPVAPSRTTPGRDEQVHGALVGLGYSGREADEALALVAAAKDGDSVSADGDDVGAVLRQALAVLRK
jgi:Holliday junction DNA helicase RuvA